MSSHSGWIDKVTDSGSLTQFVSHWCHPYESLVATGRAAVMFLCFKVKPTWMSYQLGKCMTSKSSITGVPQYTNMSQKCPLLAPFQFLNNSMKNQPIWIIFRIQHPEKTWHQKVINLPISPTKCCHTTTQSVKKCFFKTIFYSNFHQTPAFSKIANICIVLKLWKMHWLAYITASVQSAQTKPRSLYISLFDQLVYKVLLDCSPEIQSISETDAAATLAEECHFKPSP